MRGGKRAGAGRPPGVANAVSALDKAKFTHEMQTHLGIAIEALVDIAQNGRSERARIAAASEIINRAVGRAAPAETESALEGKLLKAVFECDPKELEDAGFGPVLNAPIEDLFD